jgi:hypothetical protein
MTAVDVRSGGEVSLAGDDAGLHAGLRVQEALALGEQSSSAAGVSSQPVETPTYQRSSGISSRVARRPCSDSSVAVAGRATMAEVKRPGARLIWPWISRRTYAEHLRRFARRHVNARSIRWIGSRRLRSPASSRTDRGKSCKGFAMTARLARRSLAGRSPALRSCRSGHFVTREMLSAWFQVRDWTIDFLPTGRWAVR